MHGIDVVAELPISIQTPKDKSVLKDHGWMSPPPVKRDAWFEAKN